MKEKSKTQPECRIGAIAAEELTKQLAQEKINLLQADEPLTDARKSEFKFSCIQHVTAAMPVLRTRPTMQKVINSIIFELTLSTSFSTHTSRFFPIKMNAAIAHHATSGMKDEPPKSPEV